MSLWWPDTVEEVRYLQVAHSLAGNYFVGYIHVGHGEMDVSLNADYSLGPQLPWFWNGRTGTGEGVATNWISNEKCIVMEFLDPNQEIPINYHVMTSGCPLAKAICKVKLGLHSHFKD